MTAKTLERSMHAAASTPAKPRAKDLFVDIEEPMPGSASTTWDILGEGFGSWARWSDNITSTTLDGPLAVGVIRTNVAEGIGTLTQELTAFDRSARTLTYDIRSGMPAPVRAAATTWWIRERRGETVLVGRATFELAWWAVPLKPLLRRRLTGSLQSFARQLAAEVSRQAA